MSVEARRFLLAGNALTAVTAAPGGVIIQHWCDGTYGEPEGPSTLYMSREEAIHYANGVLYAIRDADKLERERQDVAAVQPAGVPGDADRVIAIR